MKKQKKDYRAQHLYAQLHSMQKKNFDGKLDEQIRMQKIYINDHFTFNLPKN